jgi:pyrroloquinoline quinone biosynthesis protein B
MKINHILSFALLFTLLFSCQSDQDSSAIEADSLVSNVSHTLVQNGVELIVLGTVQDAGSPQINCKKECCIALFDQPDESRKVVSLGLVDHDHQTRYLLEATPDMVQQLNDLQNAAAVAKSDVPDGVFLTHGHIGHYTGLMYFGKEAMNAEQVPVFAMPRMADFLTTSGPWSQLVTRENIAINRIKQDSVIQLNQQLNITPILVPHRDEYSETVGFYIVGPNKSALFIPDIDKWTKWGEEKICEWIKRVDYAFLDATFYDAEEINNRDITEIPHPFVVESFKTFEKLSKEEKAKIYFIHFNHTNPLLLKGSNAQMEVESKGFHFAEKGQRFSL